MSATASVISLEVFRRQRQPAVEPPHLDPVEVLQTMIDCYFNALRTQLELVKQQERN